jgi:hypothetical protein
VDVTYSPGQAVAPVFNRIAPRRRIRGVEVYLYAILTTIRLRNTRMPSVRENLTRTRLEAGNSSWVLLGITSHRGENSRWLRGVCVHCFLYSFLTWALRLVLVFPMTVYSLSSLQPPSKGIPYVAQFHKTVSKICQLLLKITRFYIRNLLEDNVGRTGTHWAGGELGPRTGLNAVTGIEPRSSSLSSSLYTDWATQDLPRYIYILYV